MITFTAKVLVYDSPYEKDLYWIKYISVDKDYRQQGFAKELAEEVFKYTKEHKHKLQSSSYYSELGEKSLKPLFSRLKEKYDIDFIDGERRWVKKTYHNWESFLITSK